jgi:hypothetical protein
VCFRSNTYIFGGGGGGGGRLVAEINVLMNLRRFADFWLKAGFRLVIGRLAAGWRHSAFDIYTFEHAATCPHAGFA